MWCGLVQNRREIFCTKKQHHKGFILPQLRANNTQGPWMPGSWRHRATAGRRERERKWGKLNEEERLREKEKKGKRGRRAWIEHSRDTEKNIKEAPAKGRDSEEVGTAMWESDGHHTGVENVGAESYCEMNNAVLVSLASLWYRRSPPKPIKMWPVQGGGP